MIQNRSRTDIVVDKNYQTSARFRDVHATIITAGRIELLVKSSAFLTANGFAAQDESIFSL